MRDGSCDRAAAVYGACFFPAGARIVPSGTLVIVEANPSAPEVFVPHDLADQGRVGNDPPCSDENQCWHEMGPDGTDEVGHIPCEPNKQEGEREAAGRRVLVVVYELWDLVEEAVGCFLSGCGYALLAIGGRYWEASSIMVMYRAMHQRSNQAGSPGA
jgi:hypothetical protein